jgi:hypothetical protein
MQATIKLNDIMTRFIHLSFPQLQYLIDCDHGNVTISIGEERRKESWNFRSLLQRNNPRRLEIPLRRQFDLEIHLVSPTTIYSVFFTIVVTEKLGFLHLVVF